MSIEVQRAQHANSPRVLITRKFARGIGQILFGKILFKVEVKGMENVPESGPTILVFNHLTLFEPVAIICSPIPRDMTAIAKEEILKNPVLALLGWLWGAVTVKRGEADVSAIKQAMAVVESGLMLLLAPEGTRQKDGLRDPKEGAVMLANKTHATLLPVGVSGTENFLSNLKRLRRTPVTLNIGKPFRIKPGITRKQYAQGAEEIMYQIAPLITPRLRGNYPDPAKSTMETIEYVK
jgi:1-acyl-sn-glycerol-3-phosphate acyltransferase